MTTNLPLGVYELTTSYLVYGNMSILQQLTCYKDPSGSKYLVHNVCRTYEPTIIDVWSEIVGPYIYLLDRLWTNKSQQEKVYYSYIYI